jgi:hypothetical protein
MDEMDTVVWFRRTLAETRDNLAAMNQEMSELRTAVINGFAAAVTRTEVAELRTDITSRFAEVLKELRRE